MPKLRVRPQPLQRALRKGRLPVRRFVQWLRTRRGQCALQPVPSQRLGDQPRRVARDRGLILLTGRVSDADVESRQQQRHPQKCGPRIRWERAGSVGTQVAEQPLKQRQRPHGRIARG